MPSDDSQTASLRSPTQENDARHAVLREPDRAGWRAAELVLLLLLGIALMHSIYGVSARGGREVAVPGFDSYYHVKMAEMLPQWGLLRTFPWLKFCYFTNHGDRFVSHHYGFHVLLMPFVLISHGLNGDYLAGGRWAITFFFALNLVLLDMILIAARLRWRWVWLVLFLLLPAQFYSRHAYIRAICPSLTFMLLIVWGLFRNQPRLTAGVIAGYVHLYLGGVLYAPLVVGVFMLASIAGKRVDRKLPLRLLVWSMVGWAIGVLTHPYLHGMREFLALQVFGSGLSPDIPVGREWKPYSGVWWFARSAAPLLIVWSTALCVRLRMGPRTDARTLFLLLMNFAFLILTMKARRFVEYWPIFGLLSAALLAAPLVDRIAWWSDRFFSLTTTARRTVSRVVGVWLMVGVGLVIVGWSPYWMGIRASVHGQYDLAAVRKAMTFLQEHSDRGDVVFTDDWDIFPVYFYYNTHNHYIVGLDPKFTDARRPDLWKRYVKISRGEVPADTTYHSGNKDGEKRKEKIHVQLTDIRDYFEARFVITDRDHKPLAAKLHQAADFATLIYPSPSYERSRDAAYLIFRIGS